MIRFGRYELLERISLGGMAEVFKARVEGAAGFQKIVAVKRVLPQLSEDPELSARFVHEAKLCSNLNHSNIGQVYDFGEIDGRYYIAMEYVHGRDLRRILEWFQSSGQSMPVAMAIRIGLDVCTALDYAHTQADAAGHLQQIVHRDVSPPNILVSFEGAVKLIDFGIAKALTVTRRTATGFHRGKLGYLSPEQAEGREIDYRSDIFSLGTVLHELVTGRRLFDEDSEMATLNKVRRAEVPPPSQVCPGLSPGLDAILLRALARQPADRYQGADQFYEALEEHSRRERQMMSASQLARFMGGSFGGDLEGSTRVSPAPRGAAWLRPEPALVAFDDQTTSQPAIAETTASMLPPRAQASWPSARLQEQLQADVPDPSTRISLESARLAAGLARDPAAVDPQPGLPAGGEEEVVLEAALPPDQELTAAARRQSFATLKHMVPEVKVPDLAAVDEGWDDLKTTPMLGSSAAAGPEQEPFGAVAGEHEPEVVVTLAPAGRAVAKLAPERIDWNEPTNPLSGVSTDPGGDTMTRHLAGPVPVASLPAQEDEEETRGGLVSPIGGHGQLVRQPTPTGPKAEPARLPLGIGGIDEPTLDGLPVPRRVTMVESRAVREAPPAAERPAPFLSQKARPAAPPEPDFRNEPTLPGEEDAPLEPPAPAPDRERDPTVPASPLRTARVEEPSVVDLPDRAKPGAMADQYDNTIPMPSLPDEPEIQKADPPRRPGRAWLVWLALAMFALGLGGTLLALTLRAP